MWEDPIVEEVRKVRREIAAKYPTPEAYYRHIMRVQKRYAARLVRSGKADGLAGRGVPVRK
jgi:hypothetical protein